MPSAMEILALFLATIVAAVINALAGGGGLITFTLLLLVVHPVAADATSAIALVTGYPAAVWRTRDELTQAIRCVWLWLLLIPCVLGGLAGALVLSWAGDRDLLDLVPWLVLGATLLILLRPYLTSHANSGRVEPNLGPWTWPVAMVAMFVIALYGGYFGAGVGIMVIGALGYMG
ncbi:MAG TPA: sulfite exporter TauE/SafE family protein, partial [Hyphomicrobiaceae bacterium]